MAFDVIDADEGFARGPGDGFGKIDADEQGTDQAGALRDGEAIEFVRGDLSLLQRRRDDAFDFFEMFARSDFRHYAAKAFMGFSLGMDDVRDDARAVFDHGGSGFVAGTFNAED